MSVQRTQLHGYGFQPAPPLCAGNTTSDNLVESMRKIASFIDRSQIAVAIRCHPSVYDAIKLAFQPIDDVGVGHFIDIRHDFRMLKISKDVGIWPLCYEIEYVDGLRELVTPFGSVRIPPPIQTQPQQQSSEPTTATQPTNYSCPTVTNNE